MSGASGPFWIPPSAVIRPRSEEDVAGTLAWASLAGVPLVPRGAGTGMPAGNVGPWVVLDLTGLRHVLAADPELRTVRGSPGVVAAEAQRAAVATGLDLPGLPSSRAWCTLGGMVATNAAGARALRHGATREALHALRWVEADGTVHAADRTSGFDGGRTPSRWQRLHDRLSTRFHDGLPWPGVAKNSSGYALDRWLPSADPLDLLAGSEGTLGIVTEVTLRLHDRDEARWVGVAGVPGLADLVHGSVLARELGANACEYFGAALVELGGLGSDPRLSTLVSDAGMLLVEFGGEPDEVAGRIDEFRTWAVETGGIVEAESEAARISLWDLRHEASPRIMRRVGEGRRSVQFIEDCVVPVEHLDEFVRRLDEITAAHRLPTVVFGHAGQGNLHVNPLVDPTDPDWRRTVAGVLDAVVDLVASLGGTLAGEHGDGRLRAPFLSRIYRPEVVEAFREVKTTLDPFGILNPGVILPAKGADPLAGLGAAPDFRFGSQGPEAARR